MRCIYICLNVAALLVLSSVHARSDVPERVVVDLRVVANRTRDFLVWRAHNATGHELRFGGIMGGYGISRFVYDRQANRASRWYSVHGEHGPSVTPLKAGESRKADFSTSLLLMHAPNAFSRWKWHGVPLDQPPDIEIVMPPEFLIGYAPAEGGHLRPPYVDTDSGAVSNMLAFVFHQNTKGGFPLDNVPPNELAFLTLNGTDEPQEVAPPLSVESILHVSAPGIGFSAEITLQDSGFEARTIEPGESGQWRIPFERILEQIPAETVEAIRAADGALDLVWKSGEIESPPLPLILLPPTQAELDAAFLAEHADVPRIDEHTDLSLDFCLAGIENEPVLLGRLRNNEPHAVLWDDQSRKSSILRVSPRFGMSFDLTRSHYGWRPNIIDAAESIALSISVRKFAEEQRGRRPEIAKVGFVMAGRWEFFNKTVNTIWMAIPGINSQFREIHADASWYSIQDQQREGRHDRIAPLLAYVHTPDTPPELTCVLWNRTEEAINVTSTRIVVTAPAIDYRRELSLPTGLDLPATVAPGEHTDWRVDWQTIRDMIPADDFTRIKATGGELDLVWQVNGLDSPPLPLLLGWKSADE